MLRAALNFMNSNSNSANELSQKYDKSYYFHSEDDFSSQPPDIYELFRYYNAFFFKEKLSSCEVKWSKRMTLCAGTCAHSGPNYCTITLSEALLQFRTHNDLKQTLLHEMIHAYLFLTNPAACRAEEGHGVEFKTIMNVINDITGLNITVYHTFHDEVDIMRKHVWKCDGPCKENPPFFGVVKRAMNRAPGPKDYWHERHMRECGGKFTKIAGPEMGEEKNEEKKKIEKKKPAQKGNRTKKKKEESQKGRSSSLTDYFKKKPSSSQPDVKSEGRSNSNKENAEWMTQDSIIETNKPPAQNENSLSLDIYLTFSEENNKILLANMEVSSQKDMAFLKSILKSIFLKPPVDGGITAYIDREKEIPLEDEKLEMGYILHFFDINQFFLDFNKKVFQIEIIENKDANKEGLEKGFKINLLNDELVDELNYLFL